MERDRVYAVLFVVLTILKLAAPGAPSAAESEVRKLFGAGKAMKIAETLGYGITGDGIGDAVFVSFFP